MYFRVSEFREREKKEKAGPGETLGNLDTRDVTMANLSYDWLFSLQYCCIYRGPGGYFLMFLCTWRIVGTKTSNLRRLRPLES